MPHPRNGPPIAVPPELAAAQALPPGQQPGQRGPAVQAFIDSVAAAVTRVQDPTNPRQFRGLTLSPGQTATPNAVLQALSDLVGAALDDEITNDPFAIGYAGKTAAQIAALMAAPPTAVAPFDATLDNPRLTVICFPFSAPVIVQGVTTVASLLAIATGNGADTIGARIQRELTNDPKRLGYARHVTNLGVIIDAEVTALLTQAPAVRRIETGPAPASRVHAVPFMPNLITPAMITAATGIA